jgi:hypothetical protein
MPPSICLAATRQYREIEVIAGAIEKCVPMRYELAGWYVARPPTARERRRRNRTAINTRAL